MFRNRIKPWILFSVIILIEICATSNYLMGQEFQEVKKLKLRGVPIDYLPIQDGKKILVIEQGVLNLYDALNLKFLQTVDTIFNYPRHTYFCNGRYIKQSKDSIALIPFDGGEVEKFAFNDFLIFNAVADLETGMVAMTGRQSETGISLLTKQGIRTKLVLPPNKILFKISISPGGRFLAVKTLDLNYHRSDMYIMNLHTKQIIQTLDADNSYDCSFNTYNDQLYILDIWGQIRSYSISNGRVQAEKVYLEDDNNLDTVRSSCVQAFGFLKDPKRLLSISEHGILSLWDPKTTDKLKAVFHQITPVDLKINANSSSALISCKDSSIRFVSLDKLPPEKPVNPIEIVLQTKMKGNIEGIFHDKSTGHLFTVDKASIKIWDSSNLLQINSINDIYEPKLSSDKNFLIGSSRIIDAKNLKEIAPEFLKKFGNALYDIDKYHNLVLVNIDDTVSYFDLISGRKVKSLFSYQPYLLNHKNKGSVDLIAIQKDRQLIAAAINYASGICGSWQIVVNDLRNGEQRAVFDAAGRFNSCIHNIQFSNQLPYLAFNDEDYLFIWDYSLNKIILTIKEPFDNILASIKNFTFSPDGKFIYIGYLTGVVTKWNLSTLKKDALFDFGEWNSIAAIDFIDNNTAYLAVKNELMIYDFEKKQIIIEFGNKQQPTAITKLLENDKTGTYFTLQDEKLYAWDCKSLMNFKNSNWSVKLPKYLKDIAFNNDSTGIICTDYFDTPSTYYLQNEIYRPGHRIELADGKEYHGIKSIPIKNHCLATICSGGFQDLKTIVFFDKDGKMAKNLWSVLRFGGIDQPLAYDSVRNYLFLTLAQKRYPQNILFKIDLNDFTFTTIALNKKADIRYLKLIDDHTLLMAGNIIQKFDLVTQSVTAQCGMVGGQHFDYDAEKKYLYSFSSGSIRVWYVGSPIYCVKKKYLEEPIENAGLNKQKDRVLVTYRDSKFRILSALDLEPILSTYSIDSANYIVLNKDNYYYSTKSIAPGYLSYRQDSTAYLFDQFDLELNRPDIVANDFKNMPVQEKELLTSILKRRLDEQGRKFKTSPGKKITPLIIKDRSKIATLSKQNFFSFSIGCGNVVTPIKAIHLFDNGNLLKNNATIIGKNEAQINLQLNLGLNRIKIYADLADGSISSIEEIKILYKTDIPVRSTTYFIGIGVSKYKNEPGKSLNYADKDISDIADIIHAHDPSVVSRMFLNEHALHDSIFKIQKLLENSKIEDKVIILISTHGIVQGKSLFLATYDMDFLHPEHLGLGYEEIQRLLNDIPARKKLLLIDACYSGEIGKDAAAAPINPTKQEDGIEKLKRSKQQFLQEQSGKLTPTITDLMRELFANSLISNGTIVISASRGTGLAEEANGNGAFTTCLKAALSGKSDILLLKDKADKDENGLNINELTDYLIKNVPLITDRRQQPTTRQENIEYDWKIW
jgi:hypothetical protein